MALFQLNSQTIHKQYIQTQDIIENIYGVFDLVLRTYTDAQVLRIDGNGKIVLTPNGCVEILDIKPTQYAKIAHICYTFSISSLEHQTIRQLTRKLRRTRIKNATKIHI